MARITILFAAGLIILGIAGYIISGMASITALIPAAFGMVLLLLGLLALKEKLRMHAMHGAALLALIGILGTATGIWKTIQYLLGTDIPRPAAAIVQAIMCIALLDYLALCIISFIKARRARKAAQ